jgi:hypothetical protein
MKTETLSRVKAEIGAPVHNPVGGRIGHICALTRSPGTYAIGADASRDIEAIDDARAVVAAAKGGDA